MITAGTERRPSVDPRRFITTFQDGVGVRVTDLCEEDYTIYVCGVPMYVAEYDDDIDD